MAGNQKLIEEQIRSGDHTGAFQRIRNILSLSNEFSEHIRLLRLLHSLDRKALNLLPLRIAVVGDSTLNHLIQVLEAHLIVDGFEPTFYLSKFGTLSQTILDPTSELYRFRPELVWVFTTYRDTLLDTPSMLEDASRAKLRVDEAVRRTRSLWQALETHCSALIIQNNSDYPPVGALGNLSGTTHWGPGDLIRQYNHALISQDFPRVVLFDFEAAARRLGAGLWVDNQLWHHSRHAIALDASTVVARRVSRLIRAAKGRAKKCLVLDLDNTLWGGNVGDEGVQGIQLGSGSEGESFIEIQEYVKALKDRGVLLAVCSKNDERSAKAVFSQHAEMRLKLDDISVFMANWGHKPDNIREIALRLNIGLDSIVFVDDSPAEREFVRRELPGVDVPELPDHPTGYVSALETCGYFESVSVSEEDLARSNMYSQNALRTDLQLRFTNINAYLEDLQMQCEVGTLDPDCLPRMAQLMQRSNQFNLTNQRYTAADFEAARNDSSIRVLFFKLKDRFGDYGLISVVVLRRVKEALEILSWVMSCRVFSRGLEEFIINVIAETAAALPVTRLIGRFVRTERNEMVSELYSKLGFSCVETSETGSLWERALPFSGGLFRPFISRVEGLPRAKPHPEQSGPSARSRDVLARLPEASDPERREMITTFVSDEVKSILDIRSEASIDPRKNLIALGMDSLSGIQLRNSLKNALGSGRGVHVSPILIFTHPTIERIVEHLCRQFSGTGDSATTESAQEARLAAHLGDRDLAALSWALSPENAGDPRAGKILSRFRRITRSESDQETSEYV